MLGAGLRVAEVCSLDVADILTDQDGETALFVRQGKGRKDRTVPVQADVARHLRTYLAATKRRFGGDGPLFRAHDRAAGKRPEGTRHGRLSTRAVGDVVTRCTAAALMLSSCRMLAASGLASRIVAAPTTLSPKNCVGIRGPVVIGIGERSSHDRRT